MDIIKPNIVNIENLPVSIDLFIAGGIRNTSNWQAEVETLLEDTDGIAANPRRPEGILTTGDAAAQQIAWEFEALKRSRTVMFWFPDTSVCPIALYELGVQVGRGTETIVGAAPDYERRFDLIQQLSLAHEFSPQIDNVVKSTIEETVNTYISRSHASR